MALADDIQKLARQQAVMQRNVALLKKRLDKVEQRVDDIDGEEPEETPEEPDDDYVPFSSVREPVSARKEPVDKEQVHDAHAQHPRVHASKETSKPIENLGFKIFGGVGFFLILLGLFYLYSYAVSQGWINHLGRILMGAFFSAIILSIAEIFRRKKYERFSQMLTGGGIGLLYFVVLATYYFPEYRAALGMTQMLNTILLFAVMLIAVYLSLRLDSQILTCFAFFLGFVSALLAGSIHQTMIATLVLATGMTLVLMQRKWNLALYPVIASYLLYTIYFASHNIMIGQSPEAAAALVYLVLFFILFNALSMVQPEEKDNTLNVTMAVINAAAVLLFGMMIVGIYWEQWKGAFLLVIAVTYFGMMFVARQRNARSMFETFFLLAITFITIAIPVQLDYWMIAAPWAIVGLLLVRSAVFL